jgi:cell filamentation protein, protein adenylyltransferase
MDRDMIFKPNFEITPQIAKSLMAIEAAREKIDALPVTAAILASLRESARLIATHYSTQIEGNRLTAQEIEEVIEGGRHIKGRERDEAEVRNYYRALNYVERIASKDTPFKEKELQTIHGLVMDGKERASAYRDGQNVIRDSVSRNIVYMPPEAPDVPKMMKGLVDWLNVRIEKDDLPIPAIAALAHYQFATIHPYYDGNGRTARLLTNLILHRLGYGLKGVYSLDEYYAQDLPAYYDALTVGDNHNYYEGGRETASLAPFLAYFLEGIKNAFNAVQLRAAKGEREGAPDQSRLLRKLDAGQRKALGLFKDHEVITARDLSAFLKISERASRDLCVKWVDEGFLQIQNPSKKARSYRLTPKYEALVS